MTFRAEESWIVFAGDESSMRSVAISSFQHPWTWSILSSCAFLVCPHDHVVQSLRSLTLVLTLVEFGLLFHIVFA